MICVDTCFVIDFLRGMDGALERARELEEQGGCAITSVSIFELHVGTGAYGPRLRARSVAKLKSLLDRFETLDLDSFSAERAARIVLDSRRKGRPVGQNAASIAAICIEGGCEALLTRNVGHFEGIPGLRVETYPA